VRIVPTFNFLTVEVWPNPPFTFGSELPVSRLDRDTLAVVLEVCMNACKIFSGEVVGWVDKCELDHA